MTSALQQRRRVEHSVRRSRSPAPIVWRALAYILYAYSNWSHKTKCSKFSIVCYDLLMFWWWRHRSVLWRHCAVWCVVIRTPQSHLNISFLSVARIFYQHTSKPIDKKLITIRRESLLTISPLFAPSPSICDGDKKSQLVFRRRQLAVFRRKCQLWLQENEKIRMTPV